MRCANWQKEVGVHRSSDTSDLLPVDEGHCSCSKGGGETVDGYVYAQSLGGDIRIQAQLIDANIGHWFQPYGLPDARRGGVEDSFRFARLFAPRLIAFGGIRHRNGNLFATCPVQAV